MVLLSDLIMLLYIDKTEQWYLDPMDIFIPNVTGSCVGLRTRPLYGPLVLSCRDWKVKAPNVVLLLRFPFLLAWNGMICFRCLMALWIVGKWSGLVCPLQWAQRAQRASWWENSKESINSPKTISDSTGTCQIEKREMLDNVHCELSDRLKCLSTNTCFTPNEEC